MNIYHFNFRVHKDDRQLIKDIVRAAGFKTIAELVRAQLSATALIHGMRSLKVPHRVKTHCPKGHAFTKENSWYSHDGRGKKYRRCRMCSILNSRRWRRENKLRADIRGLRKSG